MGLQFFIQSIERLHVFHPIFILLLIIIVIGVKYTSKTTAIFILRCIGGLYLLLLIDILFLIGHSTTHTIELMPLHTILDIWYNSSVHSSTLIYNAIANILIFLPLGLFLPIFLLQYTAKFHIIAGISFVIFCEIVQFLCSIFISHFNRVTDIDDIIFGIIGFLLGYGAYILIKKYRRT